MKRVPLWRQIQKELTEAISANRYRVGEKLPTEAEFAALYSVNRHTVRRALAALAEAGLVRSQQGSGVYVAIRPIVVPIDQQFQVYQRTESAGHAVDHLPVAVALRAPNNAEVSLFNIDKSSRMLASTRRTTIDTDPFSMVEWAVPFGRTPALDAALRRGLFLQTALAELASQQVHSQTAQMSALTANGALARELGVREGTALQLVKVVVSRDDGLPIAVSQTYYLADRISFSATFGPHGEPTMAAPEPVMHRSYAGAAH
ncbi:MAG: GntR family transcriptional regulator [Pseudomonadota bacterium]